MSIQRPSVDALIGVSAKACSRVGPGRSGRGGGGGGDTKVGCGYYAKTRSTMIEVQPIFPEAPHLRSSIHNNPKTDFSRNQIASQRIIPWPKYTKTLFFRNKICIPTISG